jgi:hypothetical protein
VHKLQALNSLSSISEQFLHTLQLNDATKLFCDIDEKNVHGAISNVFDFFAAHAKRNMLITDPHFPLNPINIGVYQSP